MTKVSLKESNLDKKKRLGRLFDAFFVILAPYQIILDEDGIFFDRISEEQIPSNAVKLIVKREYTEKFNNFDWDTVVFAIRTLLSSGLIKEDGKGSRFDEAKCLVLNNPEFEGMGK